MALSQKSPCPGLSTSFMKVKEKTTKKNIRNGTYKKEKNKKDNKQKKNKKKCEKKKGIKKRRKEGVQRKCTLK